MPLIAEVGWGGLVQAPETITWTDISTYVDVDQQGVTIARGASDELSETQPGTATLLLDNVDGRFTAGNALSPYYPYVRRNAPIRISVAVMPAKSGSAPYPMAQLADDFDDNRVNTTLWPSNYGGATETGGRARIPVTTAGSAGFLSAREWTLTGSKLTARLVTLPGANGSSVALASMWANSTTSGTRLGWRYNAVTGAITAENQVGFTDAAPTSATYNPRDYAWLRIRESGGTVYWESSGDGWEWTVRRTLATPAWVTSQTLTAEFPTSRTGGTNDFVEWDLVGAEVRSRFWGLVNDWPTRLQGLSSTVLITCTDLFKRLNRRPALRSMLGEEILTLSPMVYFPLTEDSTSTTAGDVGGNGAPSLAITQAGAGGTLALGSADGPTETGEQVPVFTPSTATAGKWLMADLGPQFEDTTVSYLTFEAWFKTTTTGRAIMGVHSLDLVNQHVLSIAAGGTLQIEWTSDGTALTVEAVTSPATLADGNWHHVVYDQREGKVWIDGTLTDSALAVPRRFYERVLHVGGYRGTRLWNGSIGHAVVYATDTYSVGPLITGHYSAGMTGFAGEDADVRMQRLASYAGVDSVTISGSTFDPIASQGPGGTQVVARMREVESTESGRLFAERDYYGLAFQSRDLRYNPDPSSEVFTIAYADLETKSVELADDDQKLVNSLEASRPGGATQKVTAPSSIQAFGIYDPGALSILKTSDNSVLDAAYWRVSRYADPAPELREVPIEAYTMSTYLDILDADISSYFSVTSMPAQSPASSMRVTVEGYTETIKEKSHLIQFHTSATNNDSVWVLDDPTYSVLDSTTRLAY
ncbi:LamG-like jellyroll fold domain-containing protein [Streptomyces pseudovenezuelae]|uniref:LamG-like jellyroll fold domain-containing protein n=1 Tax=Streptomyces pseudovenezuelae TaxID=67350 RepID=UPI002E326F3F|nr:LamG-like jellyroll fold domain-containing protein [Streptomyces pseudovenezuelae]